MPVDVLSTTPHNSITSDPPRSYVQYEAETIVFGQAVVDWDVKSNSTNLFKEIQWAREITIRTDADIQFRFRNTDEDAIELWKYETYAHGGYSLDNIYITAGKNTTVRIVMFGWN